MGKPPVIVIAVLLVLLGFLVFLLGGGFNDLHRSKNQEKPTRWIHKGTCTATLLNGNAVVYKSDQQFAMEHDGKPDPYSKWRFGGESLAIPELGSSCTVTNHGSQLDCSWMDRSDDTAKTFTHYEIFGVKTVIETLIDFAFVIEKSVRVYPTGEQVGDGSRHSLHLNCTTE